MKSDITTNATVMNVPTAAEAMHATELLSMLEIEDVLRYRRLTIDLLRRFFEISFDLGRVPAMLSFAAKNGFMRTRCGGNRNHAFENLVIFITDVEHCLQLLDRRTLELIGAMAIMGYTEAETAKMLSLSERRVRGAYNEAIDQLSAILIGRGLLKLEEGVPVPKHRVRSTQKYDLESMEVKSKYTM